MFFVLQASHEVFVQQLKEILEESREEIGEIQTEVNTYQEAAIVKREKEARVAHEQPKMIHSGQTTRFSPSQKVNLNYDMEMMIV